MFQSPVGFEMESGQHTEIVELETRNRELAALLAQHVQTNEQLVAQNTQIVGHCDAMFKINALVTSLNSLSC